jgi:hypothetical protein
LDTARELKKKRRELEHKLNEAQTQQALGKNKKPVSCFIINFQHNKNN